MKINKYFKNKYPEMRFLIRKSGTEPLLRTLIEGNDAKDVKVVNKKLITQINKILK